MYCVLNLPAQHALRAVAFHTENLSVRVQTLNRIGQHEHGQNKCKAARGVACIKKANTIITLKWLRQAGVLHEENLHKERQELIQRMGEVTATGIGRGRAVQRATLGSGTNYGTTSHGVARLLHAKHCWCEQSYQMIVQQKSTCPTQHSDNLQGHNVCCVACATTTLSCVLQSTTLLHMVVQA